MHACLPAKLRCAAVHALLVQIRDARATWLGKTCLREAQGMHGSQRGSAVGRRYLAANTVSAQDVLVVEIGAQNTRSLLLLSGLLPCYMPRSCPDGFRMPCMQASTISWCGSSELFSHGKSACGSAEGEADLV